MIRTEQNSFTHTSLSCVVGCTRRPSVRDTRATGRSLCVMKKMVRGTSFLSRSKAGAKPSVPVDEPAVTDSGAGTIPTPAAAVAQQPIAPARPMTASSSIGSPGGADENAALRTESERLREENEALKGQVHLLKFKVDLLVDMVTLANLDCDKLEDEVRRLAR